MEGVPAIGESQEGSMKKEIKIKTIDTHKWPSGTYGKRKFKREGRMVNRKGVEHAEKSRGDR